MTSQILKSLDFTKTQKSRCLENEAFFLQIKKICNYTSSATLSQKITEVTFVAEVTFKSFQMRNETPLQLLKACSSCRNRYNISIF